MLSPEPAPALLSSAPRAATTEIEPVAATLPTNHGEFPAVSVLMVAHNAARWLPESIESVARQSLTDIELVLVDDGSTDDTPQVVSQLSQQFPGLTLRSERLPTQRGIGMARRRAAELCRGEFIAILDADDVAHLDRCLLQMQSLAAHPSAWLCCTPAITMTEQGGWVRLQDSGARTHSDLARLLLGGQNPIVHSSVMLRRSMLRTLPGYRLDLAEDFDVWLQGLAAGLTMLVLPNALVQYRRHSSSATQTDPAGVRTSHWRCWTDFRQRWQTRALQPADTAQVAPAMIAQAPNIDQTPTVEQGVTEPVRRRGAFVLPGLNVGGTERWMLTVAEHGPKEQLEWVGCLLLPGSHVQPGAAASVAARLPVWGSAETAALAPDSITPYDDFVAALTRLGSSVDVLVAAGVDRVPERLRAAQCPLVSVAHMTCEWERSTALDHARGGVALGAVSRQVASIFPVAAQTKVQVIHNGVDPRRCVSVLSADEARQQLGIEHHGLVVGYLGRLSHEKNPLATARVTQELAAQEPGAGAIALYATGDPITPPWRSAVEGECPGRVRWVVGQTDVAPFLRAIDVLIVASESEGCSLAVIEAWLAGCPVVATCVGAIPELEAQWGPLVSAVPPQPTATELAAAVRVATSPEFLQTVVPRVQRLAAQELTAEVMAQRWTDWLVQVAQQGPVSS